MEALLWALPVNSARVGESDQEKNSMKEISASVGKYSGTARVIHDESEFNRVQKGDVLICTKTTSSWSVIFAEIGALITEEGGLLSHPAIVAREYGIPYVTAVPDATKIILDGQEVEVDGDTGVVRIRG